MLLVKYRNTNLCIIITSSDFKSDLTKLFKVAFIAVNQFDDGVMFSTYPFSDSCGISDQVEFLNLYLLHNVFLTLK